jgi:hypothetical protein
MKIFGMKIPKKIISCKEIDDPAKFRIRLGRMGRGGIARSRGRERRRGGIRFWRVRDGAYF